MHVHLRTIVMYMLYVTGFEKTGYTGLGMQFLLQVCLASRVIHCQD